MEEMGAEAGMFLSAPIHTFPHSLITAIKGNTALALESTVEGPK